MFTRGCIGKGTRLIGKPGIESANIITHTWAFKTDEQFFVEPEIAALVSVAHLIYHSYKVSTLLQLRR